MRIAIYMRLSKEDPALSCERHHRESNSIANQRILLTKYISEKFPDACIQEFADDGYSGVNFRRPAVQKLFEQVRRLQTDCIVVKDFSRFSRDYMELGACLERIFPFYGIRFISVNDHYDSQYEHGTDLAVQFKSLLYDLYSKDLSQKVRSSLAVRKANGSYVSANCPFGYEKDPDDRHKLLIAPEEAAIVKRIFKLTAEGFSCVQIARLFQKEKIKTPAQFKSEKGQTIRPPKGNRFLWSTSFICQVLKNRVYVGDIVYGKYVKDAPGEKTHAAPKETWQIVYNHHEPIIERDFFEQIQKTRGKKRTAQHRPKHPLTGKVICGCCKRNLRYRHGKNAYFYCHSRFLAEQENSKFPASPDTWNDPDKPGCIPKIPALYLEEYVLFMLQKKTADDKSQPDISGSDIPPDMPVYDQLKNFVSQITVYGEQHIEIKWTF